MAACWSCESPVPVDAAYCPSCGHSLSDRNTSPLFVVDAVTGLFNAVFMQAIIDQEAHRAQRYHRPLSVLVVEIDHADFITRDLPEQQVAMLLRELAQALVAAVRDTDTVGFLDGGGSPRFAVVLPETEHPGAIQAADKVRRLIASRDFQSGGAWARLTVSCAAAATNPDRAEREDLIASALIALLGGRSSGPNRTHAVTPF